MAQLTWDQSGSRFFETGVDRGVLYIPDASGAYVNGYAWNGLTTVTESPSGAEASPQYADNIKYLNLVSVEQFGGTIEAFTYPDQFAQCDGTAVPTAGVAVGQQNRKSFGLAYRTKLGNDLNSDLGYKLHLIYGALAKPSEKAYATVNDSPEALTFSWEFTTSPIDVPGLKPTALITIDSTKVDPAKLSQFETTLYGSAGANPLLPFPGTVISTFSGTVQTVTPTKPTQAGNVLTIPTTAGVVYSIDGVPVSGNYTLTSDAVVTASPAAGYQFPKITDNDWLFIKS